MGGGWGVAQRWKWHNCIQETISRGGEEDWRDMELGKRKLRAGGWKAFVG